MNNQIPLEKVLEKYGKVCLERDMAFERIDELENQVNALNTQIADMAKAATDPPDIKEPGPGPQAVGAASSRD